MTRIFVFYTILFVNGVRNNVAVGQISSDDKEMLLDLCV